MKYKLPLELSNIWKGQREKGILFKRNKNFGLETYTDVDYIGSVVYRILIVGYCVFLGGNLES